MYVIMNKFKVLSEEIYRYDNLKKKKEKTYQKLVKTMKRVRKKGVAKIDQERAMRPIQDMFAGAGNSKKGRASRSVW